MLKFLNALAALATIGTFIIAFLNSYEVRIKVRRPPALHVAYTGCVVFCCHSTLFGQIKPPYAWVLMRVHPWAFIKHIVSGT